MSQQYKIGTHKTNIFEDENFTYVIYHSTAVVKYDFDKIILNTGGWRTSTTKTRMNQSSNQFNLGFQVYQKDFDWFVDYCGKTYNFDEDELIIKRRNTNLSNRF